MSSKHILGIGQLEPGKVVIIHGNMLECDHAKPLATLEDCPQCVSVMQEQVALATEIIAEILAEECEECLKAAKMPVGASGVAEHVQGADLSATARLATNLTI